MKRTVIKIDDSLCIGCGVCVEGWVSIIYCLQKEQTLSKIVK